MPMLSLLSFPVTAKLLLLICLPITILVGCQSSSLAPQNITNTELNKEVLFFGRIRWIQDGVERTDYKNTIGWNISAQYYRIDDEENGSLGVNENGYFTWRLPKGTYLAYSLTWQDSWDGLHRLPLHLAFQATQAQKAYCVGTLIVKLQTKRDLIGGLWIKHRELELNDSCDQDLKWFQAHYVNLKLPIEKSLLVYNSNIPDNIRDLEQKANVSDIMRAIYPLFMPVEMK
jgi:hypothetical protein